MTMMSFTQKFLEFSRPFVDAAKSVFETMVFTKIEAGRPGIKPDSYSRGDISSVMGIVGTVMKEGQESSFRGMMVISFPLETYVKIASSMLMEEHTKYSDSIADVGSEISNMITGNAKRVLVELGYNIRMSIPSTISGANHELRYPPATYVILIPFTSSLGDFYIEICYQDK